MISFTDLDDCKILTQNVDDVQSNCGDDSGNMLGQVSIPNPLTIGMNHSSLDGGSRIWRGLEPGVHETTVKKAEIGRSGLAMRYTTAADSAHLSCISKEA